MEIRPGEYLAKHIENPQDEESEVENLPDHSIVEGASIDYYRNQRELNYEKGDSSLEIAFTEVPPDIIIDYIHDLQRSSLTAGEEEKKLIDELINFYYTPPIYTIDKYRLRKGEHALDLDDQELKKEIPNLKITFNPRKKIDVFNSGEKGRIMASGDITKVGTIIGILHEIGHLVNPKGDDIAARRRYAKRENVTQRESSGILESERNAWAFALEKIKPFLDQNSRDCVISSMHSMFLQTYSDNLRKQIAPDWMLFIAHAKEYLEDII